MAEEPPPSSSLDVAGIGELSKVGRDLIQIFAKRWIEPGTIRAIAQANADAYRIEGLAKTEVQIQQQQLLERATIRMAKEAISKQENVEKVVLNAASQLQDSNERPADPDKIDQDWTTAFVRHVGEVSNQQMQELWSRILTGEARKPGTFSKRTMNLVAELSKEEAEMFETLCRYTLPEGPAIFDFESEIYVKNKVTFELVTELQGAGLVDVIHVGEFTRIHLPKLFAISYDGRVMLIPNTGGTLLIGKVRLTSAGVELANICDAKPVPEFFDFLLRHWYKQGATELLPPSDSEPNPKQRTINDQGQELIQLVDEAFVKNLGPLPIFADNQTT